MHVLLIEDDPLVASGIRSGLMMYHFVVEHVTSVQAARQAMQSVASDVVILDRGLPDGDGLALLQSWRDEGVTTPVLMLTARDAVRDRVGGLQSGADDYLVKPFAFAELLARIEVILRRQENSGTQTRLKVADLEMDLLAHKVTRNGEVFNLQPREYKLLEYLMRHAGQVVTRTMLLENVWDYHFDPQTNVIDVHISRLRQKIDKGFDRQLLTTVRGAGYMLDDAQ